MLRGKSHYFCIRVTWNSTSDHFPPELLLNFCLRPLQPTFLQVTREKLVEKTNNTQMMQLKRGPASSGADAATSVLMMTLEGRWSDY